MYMFQDPLLGAISAPDDATADEINMAVLPMRQQTMMMQGLGGLGRMVATTFAPEPYTVKPVSGVAAMAMGQDYGRFRERQLQHQGQMQQAQQSQQRNELLERHQLMQATQMEKDRQARLNYESLRMRNDEKERAFQEKLQGDKFEFEKGMAQERQALSQQQADARMALEMYKASQKESAPQDYRTYFNPEGQIVYADPRNPGQVQAVNIPGYTPRSSGSGALPGYQRTVISPDGQEGWINLYTKQLLTDDQYAAEVARAKARPTSVQGQTVEQTPDAYEQERQKFLNRHYKPDTFGDIQQNAETVQSLNDAFSLLNVPPPIPPMPKVYDMPDDGETHDPEQARQSFNRFVGTTASQKYPRIEEGKRLAAEQAKRKELGIFDPRTPYERAQNLAPGTEAMLNAQKGLPPPPTPEELAQLTSEQIAILVERGIMRQ